MSGDVTLSKKMRRLFLMSLVFLVSGAAYAVDPDRAQGIMTIDNTRIEMKYAYAVEHQHNDITHRKDDRRIVLTDKPLPADLKLDDIDNTFPDGTLGMVVCISHADKVTHVLLQHPKGMYDAGYFEDDPNYTFKPQKTEHGTVAGNLSSRKIRTNTMSFWFDVDFNAAMK
jgi:hypothetical protein